MSKDDMPRRGIQDLRDLVLKDLDISDPDYKGYGNLVENVITVLQRHGKIEWKPPVGRLIMALTADQLRHAADQVDAYKMLTAAGADLSDTNALVSVHGVKIGYVWWTPGQVMLALDTDASDTNWMSSSQFYDLFPVDDFELGDDE